MAKKVLITGGAGFIGFHTALRLAADSQYDVTLLDNLNEYYDITLKHNRLKHLEQTFGEKYRFVKMDLTDTEGINKLFEDNKYDIVITLAAQAGVRYAKENPSVYINSNVNGFFNVIDAARRNDCGLFIYASSSSVYGGNDSLPFRESDKCANPLSIYAASKLSDEIIAEAYKNTFGMACVGLRFFNVYGAWGRPDAVYYKWSDALMSGAEIELRDGGELYRDMTYVEDVTQSIEKLIGYGETKKADGAFHEIFNIGNESPVRMGDLLEYLKGKLDKEPASIASNPRGAEEPVMTRASTDKLKEAIHYAPNTPFQTGIDRFIEWYVKYYKK